MAITMIISAVLMTSGITVLLLTVFVISILSRRIFRHKKEGGFSDESEWKNVLTREAVRKGMRVILYVLIASAILISIAILLACKRW